jgi:hypothetical protein
VFVQQNLGETLQYFSIQLHPGLRFPRSPRITATGSNTAGLWSAGRAVLSLPNPDFGENSSLRPAILGKMTGPALYDNGNVKISAALVFSLGVNVLSRSPLQNVNLSDI